MCLSAASPIWRGFLSDIDCRWNVISEAADDRTIDEKQRKNLTSRYCSAPCYVSEKNKHFNDQDIAVDENIIEKLIEQGLSQRNFLLESLSIISQGMPETLARHYGHIFVRDPLVIMKEFVHPVDETSAYHFEVCSIG